MSASTSPLPPLGGGNRGEVARQGRRGGLLAYARLAKLDFFDFYLNIPVVWTLLSPELRLDPRALLTLLVFLAAEVSVVAAVVAFDDVTGFLDGSDVINYGPRGGPRKRKRKPLLDGTLSVEQAIRFGRAAAALGAALCVLVVLVAPHRPIAAVLLTGLVFLAGVQYSWGLKLSYRGGQELVIAGSAFYLVAVPYALVTGGTGGFVLVQSFLFGLWQILVSVYSNTNDVAGDRSVGRRNVATLSSGRTNRVFIACLSAAELVVLLGAPLLHLAPWWFPLVMLPVLLLRARQLAAGLLRRNPLVARARGVAIHRAGVLLLVLLNLVHPMVG
jgi:1,4-dihydroxy-2-naphthoate polyprenyltransferase